MPGDTDPFPNPPAQTPDAARKILSRRDLLSLRAAACAEGRRVVQCHGCFDIVHPGHIRHLRQAKSLGDILLVSITGDAAINKGTGRPLIPQELRAENLAALDFVDWVHVESRATANELLEDVRPDVYVKGREYENNSDPRFLAEKTTVERHGGRVVFSSGDVVFSSTALIAALEQSVDPFQQRLGRLTRDPALQPAALADLITLFGGKRVLVVGDTIVDTYVMCDRPEVAGESPVMTLRPIERRHFDGGAAIVARHIAAMGGRPVLVTALPENDEAEQLRRRLVAQGVEVRSIPIKSSIPEKQRFLVGAQKVMKLDLLEPANLDAAQQDRLIALADEASRWCSAAIITDFGLGTFSPALISRVCKTVRPYVETLSGDVSGRRSNLLSMPAMDLICPSEAELRDATRMYGEGLPAVVWHTLEHTGTRGAIVTMGPDGLIGFDRLPAAATGDSWQTRLRGEHVPALSPMAIDPLGCGDSLLAAATLALSVGGSMLQASFLGACAAAAQVQRLGNIPISATDLRQITTRVHAAHLAFAAPEVIESRSGRAARSETEAVLRAS